MAFSINPSDIFALKDMLTLIGQDLLMIGNQQLVIAFFL